MLKSKLYEVFFVTFANLQVVFITIAFLSPNYLIMTIMYPKTGLLCVVLAILTLVGCKRTRNTMPGDDDKQSTTFYYGKEKSETARPSAPTSSSDADKVQTKTERCKAIEVPAQMTGTSEILLKREGYYVSYNTIVCLFHKMLVDLQLHKFPNPFLCQKEMFCL